MSNQHFWCTFYSLYLWLFAIGFMCVCVCLYAENIVEKIAIDAMKSVQKTF